MKKHLLHPWLNIRIQLTLGLLFILAASIKLTDPPAFAKAVWNFHMLPAWAVNPVALVLPWLELLCGLALCLGFWIRAAASWITALLLTFTLAMGIQLARHHPVDCGCFSLNTPPKSEAQRLADMRWSMLRDLGMLLMALQILMAQRKRQE